MKTQEGRTDDEGSLFFSAVGDPQGLEQSLESIPHVEDPVEMMRHLRKARFSLTEVKKTMARGTHKIAKRTKEVTDSIKRKSSGSSRENLGLTYGSLDTKNPPDTVSVDPEEGQSWSEANPLLSEDMTKKTTAGARLWGKARNRIDSVVLHSYEDEGVEEPASLRKLRAKKEMTERVQKMLAPSFTNSILAIILYLSVGVIAYSFVFEKWTVIDSLYFAIVCLLTIGYGDISPTSDASRLFTSFYVLGAVAIISMALGVLGTYLLDAQEKAIERRREMSRYSVMSVFEASPECNIEPADQEDKWWQIWDKYHLYITSFLALAVLLTLATFIGLDENGWNVIDTVYYFVITASTIGLGDYTPQSQSSRLLAVFFAPLAVGAMGRWLSLVAKYIIDRHQQSAEKAFQSYELTMRDLEAMDDDGDGKVSRAEYLEFMLVAMGKVDEDLIARLRLQFERLDVAETGVIEKEDLLIVARRKMKSPKRKLELAEYKRQLMAKAAGDNNGRASMWSSVITSMRS